jgi:CheY-like chemotaxis protein/predicted regulator of Ras-like GTPase activity (Roadblock/LC7/MglB family)
MTAKQRILIVDDETKVAFCLQESLESLNRNFEILSVSSTEEALRQVGQKRFDLLVTDQRLPGMDGLELVEQVKKLCPEIPFILITAYGSEDVLTRAQQLGAFHYFVKPFRLEDFVQTVLGALQDEPGHQVKDPSPERPVDVLNSRLEQLRREIGTQCVLASTADGSLVAQAGILTGLDVEQLLSLVADNFAASSTMMHSLGGDQNSNFNYYRGARHDIYTASVHDDMFLVIVFDRRVQASRIGIVWLYASRAIESLRRALIVSPPALT